MMRLAPILDALSTAPDGRLLWFGSRIGDSDDVAADRTRLLAATLYESAYVSGEPVPLAFPSAADNERHNLSLALSSANSGTGRRLRAQVLDRSADDVVVRVSSLVLRVPAARIDDLEVGSDSLSGSFRSSKERLQLQPGFYYAVSDADLVGSVGIDRFYWNVRPHGGTSLVEAVTSTLNRHSCAFDLKVLDSSADYPRCDAAVLYMPSAQLAQAGPRILAIANDLAARGLLGGRTPLWTRRLAPGLGFAEDPLDGSSFGETRCRQVAAAILATLHVERRAARVNEIRRLLTDMGVRVKAPHLHGTLDRPDLDQLASVQ